MEVKPNTNEVELVNAIRVAGQSLCTGCVFHYPDNGLKRYACCMTVDTQCVRGSKHLIWKEKVNA